MSEQNISILTLTAVASGAIVQSRGVAFDGSQAGAGDAVLGIAETGAADTETVAVTALGTAVIEAGGAIAAGAAVQMDGAGKAITLAGGSRVGYALQAAAADGDPIEVFIK